tara:strand:+ start:11 stop:481 length:471 start_codon:yes stop_codon:yes gene_type:complete
MVLLDFDSEGYAQAVRDSDKRMERLSEYGLDNCFPGKSKRSSGKEFYRLLDFQDTIKRLSHVLIQSYLKEAASEMQFVPEDNEGENRFGLQYGIFMEIDGKNRECVPPPRHIIPELFEVFKSYTEEDGSFQVKYQGQTHTLQTRLEDRVFTLSERK